MSLADEFDAIPVPANLLRKGGQQPIEYSEGPLTEAQKNYPRVEISGTTKPMSLADEFDAIPVSDIGTKSSATPPLRMPVHSYERSTLSNLTLGAAKGLADLVQGPAQLILNGAAVISGDGEAGRYVKDKATQFNNYLERQEAQYQAETPGSFSAGAGRFAGGLVPFLLSAGGTAAPQAAAEVPLAKKMAEALIKSAVYGSTQPIADVRQERDGSNDFFAKKGMQAVVNGIVGAASAPAGAALSRVISPNTSPEVRALMSEGVTPTPGQILGGGWARTEDKLTSVPIIGDMIKNSQRRAVEDFNRAAYNRALDPIGSQSQAKIGRAGVEEVKDKLGAAYDALLPKLNFRADAQFSQEVGNLTTAINNGNVPPVVAKQFESILKNDVFSRMTKGGTMDGQSFKDLESVLTQKIKAYGASPDPAHKDISAALSEVLKSARGNLERANPQYAGELGKINEGYANYVRVRQAAAGVGASEGVFTPAQLQSVVKALDKSAGKGNFATGNALMQDLSEGGKTVLGGGYPNSGTPGRAMMAAVPAAAGAAYMNPLVAALVGAGGTMAAVPYTQIGQRLAAALLARRPAEAATVANAVRRAAPFIGAAASPAFDHY